MFNREKKIQNTKQMRSRKHLAKTSACSMALLLQRFRGPAFRQTLPNFLPLHSFRRRGEGQGEVRFSP
jgi:hypothetical protein